MKVESAWDLLDATENQAGEADSTISPGCKHVHLATFSDTTGTTHHRVALNVQEHAGSGTHRKDVWWCFSPLSRDPVIVGIISFPASMGSL